MTKGTGGESGLCAWCMCVCMSAQCMCICVWCRPGCVCAAHSLSAAKGGQFSGTPHELSWGKRALCLGTQDGKHMVEEH